MTVRDAVVHHLDRTPLMQIATVSGQQPWCVTVFFAADNLHDIYWLSSPKARHSVEIASNDRVAASITLPHQYGQAWQGLQVEGTAKEMRPEETGQLFQAYGERFNAHHRLSAILNGQEDSRLYRLKPTVFVLYDEQNFPTEPRQEWRPNA
jgi:uncharacterized protein YhbP (UPF0306 family)